MEWLWPRADIPENLRAFSKMRPVWAVWIGHRRATYFDGTLRSSSIWALQQNATSRPTALSAHGGRVTSQNGWDGGGRDFSGEASLGGFGRARAAPNISEGQRNASVSGPARVHLDQASTRDPPRRHPGEQINLSPPTKCVERTESGFSTWRMRCCAVRAWRRNRLRAV